jgi:hypothetical protein
MTEFDVTPLRQASVAYLYRLRDTIEVDPVYQRQGEVWSRAKQRLLIDSVINKFDIPKIYFHEHLHSIEVNGRRIKYSLVDGRQRLEAIWDFMDGRFTLAEDFELLEDGTKTAAGKTYTEIQREVPEIAALFAATSLDVMVIRTDDIELIEEMFSRLNEAVPLNAAEKRNGRGGPLRPAVRNLVDNTAFFDDRLPISNRRYRQYDLATKFLYWVENDGPADVKKQQLDDFWESVRDDGNGAERVETLVGSTIPVLTAMEGTFVHKDWLLSSVGMVSVYYLLYQELTQKAQPSPNRANFEAFEQARRLWRFEDVDDLAEPQRRLLEFDRLAQSPNDAGALKYRLDVLRDYMRDPAPFTTRADADV